jgi:hypothetical protein
MLLEMIMDRAANSVSPLPSGERVARPQAEPGEMSPALGIPSPGALRAPPSPASGRGEVEQASSCACGPIRSRRI